MLQPDAVPCSSFSTPMAIHDEYLTEAVALAMRINQRLADRSRSLTEVARAAQELVEVSSSPQPLVGPAA